MERMKALSIFMALVLLLSCVPAWQTAIAAQEPVVSGEMTAKSGAVDLTAEGTLDWVQFNTNSLTNIARKNIAEPLIQNITANRTTQGPIKDCPFTFTYSDAAGSSPMSNYGVELRGLDSEYVFTIPYINDQPQNLKVYSSVWAGDITLEFIVNGTVYYTGVHGKDISGGQSGQCFDIDYQLFDPADIVSVRLFCTADRDTQNWGGASNCLQAITLSGASTEPPAEPDHLDYPFFLMAGAAGCTEETVNEQAPASNVIDGKTTTFWHTSWRAAANDNTLHANGAGTAHNKENVENGHWIQVDLGGVVPVSGLRYLPRQSSTNGRITTARIYVSNDGLSYTQIAGPLTWASTAEEKRVEFDAVANARYVLILSQAPAAYATAGLIYIEVPYSASASEKWSYAEEALAQVKNVVTGTMPDQYPKAAQDTAVAAIKSAMSIDRLADAKVAVDDAVAVFFDSYVRFPANRLESLIATANELLDDADGSENVTPADINTLKTAIAAAEMALSNGDADEIHAAYKSLNAAVITFRGILNGPPQKRMTPLMGWASWNHYRATITESELIKQMNALVSTGLADAGYTFFNIDDGFQGGRAADGTMKIDATKFPNGMKLFADMAHERGLSAGIYTDAGANTCASIWDRPDVGTNGDGVGLYGYEEQDLRMFFVDWGYDFIKVDWCGGQEQGLDERTQYTKIGNIIEDIRNETGRYKVYNVCRWQFPGEWVVDIADSWRTGGDISPNFSSVMYQVDQIRSLAKYTGPGHVNDLDMMQVGNGMTPEEDKTHFSMWCMMSTPLMLGNDLTTISQQTLDIVTNKELIALNQDAACLQATLEKSNGSGEIWIKDLGYKGSQTKAIALLNRGTTPLSMTADFRELGFSGTVTARDLWAHEDLAVGASYTVTVPAHGVVVLKVSDAAADSNKTITQFVINDKAGDIDQEAGTISFTMPYGTDVTKFAPVITHNGAAVHPASGAAQDFTTPVTYTVTAADGTTKDYTVTVTVKEKNTAIVAGAMTAAAGQVDLTVEGSVDWVQFNSGSLTSYAKKNIAGPAIKDIAVSKPLTSAVTDAPFTFVAADAAEGANPRDGYGLQVRGLNSAYSFTLPYRNSKPQNVKVYSSVWAGDVQLEFIVNDEVLYTATYGKDTSGGQRGQCFDINYQLFNPADEVLVTLTLVADRDTQWDGAGNCLQAITLSEDDSADNMIFDPSATIVDGEITVTTPIVRYDEEGYDSAAVIAAIYGENGALAAIDGTEVSLVTGALVHAVNTIAVPDGVTVSGLKLFVWDDETDIPLREAFELAMPVEAGNATDNISAAAAKEKIANGAVLIDVRSIEEYDENHIDGAINLEYTNILTEAAQMLPDKDTEIIVYCSAGKRSAQAAQTFLYLGYENVYNLGAMDNWSK